MIGTARRRRLLTAAITLAMIGAAPAAAWADDEDETPGCSNSSRVCEFHFVAARQQDERSAEVVWGDDMVNQTQSNTTVVYTVSAYLASDHAHAVASTRVTGDYYPITTVTGLTPGRYAIQLIALNQDGTTVASPFSPAFDLVQYPKKRITYTVTPNPDWVTPGCSETGCTPWQEIARLAERETPIAYPAPSLSRFFDIRRHGHRMRVSWPAPKRNGGAPVISASATITDRATGRSVTRTVGGAAAGSAVFTKLPSSHRYRVTVTVRNAAGETARYRFTGKA